ncbi:MAG: tRNA uridine-5-carboxymethylaminomethyl(34) synthesis enzyme MnmG, partial [Actinomycetia bacterium]|nr:tRNA uridine-5-carboxymethylaminomethyl(34) synthesis enzyme MnmG [Actinomycetes bacterium]
MTSTYDIIVVGAGHGGCEAAVASARMGMKVLFLTINLDTIGQMSCNPSIGGLAKGHIVREIDALGGVMGLLADSCGINFKMLNKSKGPSVWSPRAQIDKKKYQSEMKFIIESEKNIHLFQDIAVELLFTNNNVQGIKTEQGNIFYSSSVILTTGTFMEGMIHIGQFTKEAGRIGELPSKGLSASLLKAGLNVRRLKTGTPPRLNGSTIDYTDLDIERGDEIITPFSFQTPEINIDQIPCYITYTNEKVHKLIQENKDRAPLYSGQIKSPGPRYCPSIEDKVIKFPDKNRHMIYLEPEGITTQEIYANGIPTSLPLDIQFKMIHMIKGLENCEIMKPGYAVEYDFIDPLELDHSLMTKKVKGLFLAGQINGTSGYKEAAGQGLIAGINAVLFVRNEEPFKLKRSEAYLGVLIDDLVTKGVDEPYRMFTSRA